MVCQGKAQAKRLINQPLMQPFGLGLLFFRRPFHGQTRTFKLNIQIFLTETGQRQGDAIVVIVAFFDVVRRKRLLLSGALQGVSQFVKTNPLTQQGDKS
jgi:hypothetical protein